MSGKGVRRRVAIGGDRSDPAGFAQMVADHLDSLAARGFTETTIASRSDHLARFCTWAQVRGIDHPAAVSLPVLEAYQLHLLRARKANGEPLSFHTQHQRLVPVKVFFAWAARTHRIAANPASELELPRRESRLPAEVLTEEEAEAVLCAPDLSDPLGLRDRAILEVFYSTAMRRAELAHLAMRDLDRARMVIAIRQGKGRKDRFVPISPRALYWLDRYLAESRAHLVVPPDPMVLFLARDGQGIGGDWLSRTVRGYVELAGIGKAGSCHLLRHSCATSMLEAGADIRIIAELLGHSKLETTQVYTRVSIKALRAVHAATHPTGAVRDRGRGLGLSPAGEPATLCAEETPGDDDEQREHDEQREPDSAR